MRLTSDGSLEYLEGYAGGDMRVFELIELCRLFVRLAN
jgi:hypothetical protein